MCSTALRSYVMEKQVVTYPDNNTIFGQIANNAADVVITDASEIRW